MILFARKIIYRYFLQITFTCSTIIRVRTGGDFASRIFINSLNISCTSTLITPAAQIAQRATHLSKHISPAMIEDPPSSSLPELHFFSRFCDADWQIFASKISVNRLPDWIFGDEYNKSGPCSCAFFAETDNSSQGMKFQQNARCPSDILSVNEYMRAK